MKIKDGFILRPFEDQFIAIATDAVPSLQNALIVMSSSGAYVWKLLQEDHTEQQLIEKIMRKYEVDRETASRDLTAFLTAVEQAGILEK